MILKAIYELKKAERFALETGHILRNWKQIRRETTSETLADYRKEVYKHIRTKGRGTWPDFHPLSERYRYIASGKYWKRRGRFLGRTNYNWFMQYVTAWVNRAGTAGVIRFGRAKTFAARKLEDRARQMEAGHKTRVSPEQRRLWGATRSAGSGRRGVDFFPLRKDTRQIEIKPRPIMDPVYKRNRNKVPEWYSDYLQRTIDRYKKEKNL